MAVLNEYVNGFIGLGKSPAFLSFFIGCLVMAILSNPGKNLLISTLYFSTAPIRASYLPLSTALMIPPAQASGEIPEAIESCIFPYIVPFPFRAFSVIFVLTSPAVIIVTLIPSHSYSARDDHRMKL